MNAPPARRPDAVIFDMDGLMLDSERLALRAFGEACSALGFACDPVVMKQLIGRNGRDSRRLLLAHHGEDFPVEQVFAASLEAYDAIVAAEGVPVKGGLAELLDWLEAESIARAVATSTGRNRALAKLERTGLLARFHAVVGGDEIANGKPAPDIFLAAAGRLGVAPARCIVLEDSEPGVRGALAAGIAPIMVPDLHPPSDALLAEGPRVEASLHDVLGYLRSLPR